MVASRVSKQVYVVDVPTVKNVSVNFRYNFYVSDENVNDSGTQAANTVRMNGENIDSAFMQYAATRLPRYTHISFTPVKLSKLGRKQDISDSKLDAIGSTSNAKMLHDNLDKVISEEDFAAGKFVTVHFHSGEIENQIYQLINGTIVQTTAGIDVNGISKFGLARALTKALTEDSGTETVSSETLVKGFVQPAQLGTILFDKSSNVVTDTFFDQLKNVSLTSQINANQFSDLTGRALAQPFSMHAPTFTALAPLAASVSANAASEIGVIQTKDDFKPLIKAFVDVRKITGVFDTGGMELVGYIIDKLEYPSDGSMPINHPSIIVDDPKASSTLDTRIKYGGKYSYAVRTIVKCTIPALDADSGDLFGLTLLISSKPSSKIYVTAVDVVAPPPPANLNFVWDYDENKLHVYWQFPVNSQRDIKQFQLFRRRTVDEPFELIKLYDFSDNVRIVGTEDIDEQLVVKSTNPTTSYIDKSFKKSSRYIYAACSVDAHGMTSNYSAQFEVWFDVVTNKVKRSLVSHSGAPKPYPNFYIEEDAFVDTIKVSGADHSTFSVYFTPECIELVDDDKKVTGAFAFAPRGSYALQFINIDNQRSSSVAININDARITSNDSKTVLLGPKGRPNVST